MSGEQFHRGDVCGTGEVMPAGYHAWVRAELGTRERADAELAGQFAAVHRTHRARYGASHIQRELSAHGARPERAMSVVLLAAHHRE